MNGCPCHCCDYGLCDPLQCPRFVEWMEEKKSKEETK